MGSFPGTASRDESGVGATSLPVAPLGRVVQEGTASGQDEATAS